ncbi:hypothetical protein G9A89_016007 [Geosiphon pyriformis]|nr:hypothetical protein G9A89_016007 [Geosiphon pyriformis]
MAIGKIEGATPEKIREIKNNSSELIKLDWDTEPVINFLEPEDDFEYCNKCDLIYNPPPCIIYTIPEEEELISSCASESELLLDPDSNPNNDNDDDKNNGSSSVQNSNDNDNNINSDSNFDSNYEQYIVLPDLIKEQELK